MSSKVIAEDDCKVISFSRDEKRAQISYEGQTYHTRRDSSGRYVGAQGSIAFVVKPTKLARRPDRSPAYNSRHHRPLSSWGDGW